MGDPSVALDYVRLARVIDSFFESRDGLGGQTAVSLSFVGGDEIRALNASYREIDEPTDVLSFPLWEEEGRFNPPDGWDELPLGDVVVASDFVRECAHRARRDFVAEMVLMIVHGTLHLVGFDHDTPARTAEMWRVQDDLRDRYFEFVPPAGGLSSEED